MAAAGLFDWWHSYLVRLASWHAPTRLGCLCCFAWAEHSHQCPSRFRYPESLIQTRRRQTSPRFGLSPAIQRSRSLLRHWPRSERCLLSFDSSISRYFAWQSHWLFETVHHPTQGPRRQQLLVLLGILIEAVMFVLSLSWLTLVEDLHWPQASQYIEFEIIEALWDSLHFELPDLDLFHCIEHPFRGSPRDQCWVQLILAEYVIESSILRSGYSHWPSGHQYVNRHHLYHVQVFPALPPHCFGWRRSRHLRRDLVQPQASLHFQIS